jgi:Zn-dependent protease
MSALPVARLLGFEIRVHVSWAIVLAVIAVTVASQVQRAAPDFDAPVAWAVGAIVAVAFLLSALAHELGHAVVARRAGMAGGPIVVYFFGGAAGPSTDAQRPRDEIVTALAGPLVSLVIGAGLMALAGVGAVVGVGPVAAVGQVALIVGVMNVALGAANLLPAFPLDGGRVARGVAWWRTGDRARGLRIAARTGRWLGLAFAAIGIVLILLVDSVDGLMLALAGWFLVSSARGVERSADVDALLEGIRVEDVMDRGATSVPAGLTLDTFADQVLAGSGVSVPVVGGPDADFIGILGARQVRRVRRGRWAQTRAGDLMVAAAGLPAIGPDTTLRAALDHLHRTGMDGLPVLEAGALTGIVTRRAVAEAIRDRAATRGVRP